MPLKVFDLQCSHAHVFEGWFSSREDFDTQHARKLISCPMCEDTDITRRLSAPRLNVSHLQEGAKAPPASAPAPAPVPAAAAPSADMAALQREVMRRVRAVIEQTENVGNQFADEARRIHHGDAPVRPIRGMATPAERVALVEEGVEIVAIPDILDADRLH